MANTATRIDNKPPRWTRTGLAGAVISLVAGAGLGALPLTSASAIPHPATSVEGDATSPTSLANAGRVTMWGDSTTGHTTVPTALNGVPVSQVVVGSEATLALTTQGKVVGWGGGLYRLQRIPDAVNAQPIASITTNGGSYAGAVTRDGRVLTWGAKIAGPSVSNVPAGLSSVKQLAITNGNAIAVKSDGTVVTWGQNASVNSPPPGLRAKAVAVSAHTVLAVTEQGTVVGWGEADRRQLEIPAAVQQPSNPVKALATANGAVLALMNDGTLVSWGTAYSGGASLPTWPTGTSPIAISGSLSHFGMVDDHGTLHQWNPSDALGVNPAPEVTGMIPSTLNGSPIAGYTSSGLYPTGAVITTALLKATDPTIKGTPTTGNTLTAVPGTFSASPTVTGQWLANGAPIAGATSTALKLTAAHAGKKISYRSTATKPGEATLTATSPAVSAANPAPPAPATSRTTLTAKVAKKGIALTIVGKVTTTRPATGRTTITIKKGRKTITTKTVTVATNGTFKLTVKKFAKLVAKKTKAKGKKAKTAYKGKYTATATYTGNARVRPSHATLRFKAK